MKISITHNLEFSEDANIKVDDNYLSITEPGFANDQVNTTEFVNHQIKLPMSIKQIFNPNNKKIISHLSRDKNKNIRIVCIINHS